jgi:alkaline phosphatase D
MPTRRQFLRRSSGAAALAVLAPHTLVEANAATRRMLRGGALRLRRRVGRSHPARDHAVDARREASGKGGVRLEIARDRDFRRVLTSKVIQTRPGIDHTVKARVGGLRADERYYYRFETATRESPVGRFQTALPRRLGAAGQARVLLAARTSRTATTTRTS